MIVRMDLISPYLYGHASEGIDLIVTLKCGRKAFMGNYKVLIIFSFTKSKAGKWMASLFPQ